ncbi:MAG: chemotaxis protein methyltransferase [Verrucomicrobiota bacterium]|jgi:chemotaxis protein methyltransferase CheR
MATLPIKPEEQQAWSGYIHQLSGVVLDASKAYLFETRLAPLLLRYDCPGYLELLARSRRDRVCRDEVIDAMTTHETSFFRDGTPFQMIEKHFLAEFLSRRGGRPLRLWCAAASTGQEPYSLSFILHEHYPEVMGCDFLASDISEPALRFAEAGIYSDFEVRRGVPPEHLARYFEHTPEKRWSVRRKFRQPLSWRQINLMENFVPQVAPRDLILCRNVAIYFSDADRRVLYDRLAESLAPGGMLLLSATESTLGYSNRFTSEEWQGVRFHRRKD